MNRLALWIEKWDLPANNSIHIKHLQKFRNVVGHAVMVGLPD